MVSEYWLGREDGLDYNQLKSLILRVISEHGAMNANSVLAEIASSGIRADVHAVRMALMRYHRLGLLKRERTGGMFQYSLSERGIARLSWLKHQNGRSE
jgi:DNA-binding transcriptional regulator PaaX